jgi:hypothetical protein
MRLFAVTPAPVNVYPIANVPLATADTVSTVVAIVAVNDAMLTGKEVSLPLVVVAPPPPTETVIAVFVKLLELPVRYPPAPPPPP